MMIRWFYDDDMMMLWWWYDDDMTASPNQCFTVIVACHRRNLECKLSIAKICLELNRWYFSLSLFQFQVQSSIYNVWGIIYGTAYYESAACLKWKVRKSNLQEDFQDVTLACEDTWNNRQHEVMLAAIKARKHPQPLIWSWGKHSQPLIWSGGTHRRDNQW